MIYIIQLGTFATNTNACCFVQLCLSELSIELLAKMFFDTSCRTLTFQLIYIT